MRTYCSVVKMGSFSSAARSLGCSKVMVSRNISALEHDLGLRLLQRTTRKMSTTADGQAYYERCLSLLEEFDSLEDSIKDRTKEASGKLRLAVPSEAFTGRHLLPFISDFARQHQQLELDVVLADRYVDIVDEGFDAAIRIGALEDSSLIAKKLANMELILCANPYYLDQVSPPKHPEDLLKHDLVIDSNYRGGQSCSFSRGTEKLHIKLHGRIRINSSQASSSLIKQGLGIGFCPSFMIRHELESGELIRLLPEWQLMRGGIYLVYSHRKHLSAKVSILQTAMQTYFDQRLL
ncbi:LysR family transcriptional regulator [Agaribacterium sp. ZY112]|uniref:LysR family transcriptional regulator n=1 Tax=Agaribacterium sp. ZY112 TaxID=3233574 RepID=UPI003525976E